MKLLKLMSEIIKVGTQLQKIIDAAVLVETDARTQEDLVLRGLIDQINALLPSTAANTNFKIIPNLYAVQDADMGGVLIAPANDFTTAISLSSVTIDGRIIIRANAAAISVSGGITETIEAGEQKEFVRADGVWQMLDKVDLSGKLDVTPQGNVDIDGALTTGVQDLNNPESVPNITQNGMLYMQKSPGEFWMEEHFLDPKSVNHNFTVDGTLTVDQSPEGKLLGMADISGATTSGILHPLRNQYFNGRLSCIVIAKSPDTASVDDVLQVFLGSGNTDLRIHIKDGKVFFVRNFGGTSTETEIATGVSNSTYYVIRVVKNMNSGNVAGRIMISNFDTGAVLVDYSANNFPTPFGTQFSLRNVNPNGSNLAVAYVSLRMEHFAIKNKSIMHLEL